MPWTGATFGPRHNKALSPAQSAHAARVANAILKRSGDEGMAIATANKREQHRAFGGAMFPTRGGMLPVPTSQRLPAVHPMATRMPALGRAIGGTIDTDYATNAQSPNWSDHLHRGGNRWGNPMQTDPGIIGQPERNDPKNWQWNPRGSARGGVIPHYDVGGSVDPSTYSTPGLAPSLTTSNPLYQGMMQRYSQMSPEQLREFVARAGGTQQGQVAQRMLQQKQMMAGSQQAQTPQQQQTQQTQQQKQISNIPGVGPISSGSGTGFGPGDSSLIPMQGMYRGGVPHLAMGGMTNPMGISASAADPPWERAEQRAIYDDNTGGGLLHSGVAGRTDHIAASPAADSYVIPADVVSGLGEGNTLAGARMIQTAMGTGPHGIPLPPGHRGPGPPRPRPPPLPREESRGGRTANLDSAHRIAQGHQRVPAMLAGGEYVLTPEQVRIIGRGDVRRGHRVLDHFVLQQRQKHIKTLKKLPGPVR